MEYSEAKILLVDDDPAIVGMVTAMLGGMGLHAVETASGIESAGRTWEERSGEFDLIVTDFSFPDGTAPELIRRFAGANPRLKVLLMTGYSGDFVEIEDQLKQRVVLLQKPFTRQEFQDVVRTQLGSSS